MAFDSDQARTDPGYYGRYEDEIAGRLTQFEALGAKVSSGDYNQQLEDFETVGMRIEALMHGARTHIGFRPFTHRVVRVQKIQTSDDLPIPFRKIGVNAYRALRPTRYAKLVGARVWTLLGTQLDSPSMAFGIGFDNEETVMTGSSTCNVNIPYTLERQYEKVAALNVITLLEDHHV